MAPDAKKEKKGERERERGSQQFRLTKTARTLPLSIVSLFLRSLSIYRRPAVTVRPLPVRCTRLSSPVYFDLPIDRSRHAVSERNRFHDERKVQNTLIHGSSSGMAQVQPVFLLLLLPLLLSR